MSVSVDSGDKTGKKSVNADLNLVPYIDLLTCMVAFLLITAVWSQLGASRRTRRGKAKRARTRRQRRSSSWSCS